MQKFIRCIRNGLLVVLLLSRLAQSDGELIEVKVPVTSDKPERVQARQEMLDKAITDMSSQYIQDLIGAPKFERNRVLIKSKILRNSGKYVLFLKESNAQYGPAQSTMTVEMKVSLKNLEAMLLEEGLLYKTEGPPKVLPLVTFVDRGQPASYSWWVAKADDKGNLRELTESFDQQLKKDLREVGFFGLNPTRGGYYDLLGSAFHSENLPAEDFLSIGEFFQAPIVVRGSVLITPVKERSQTFRLDFKLSALHSGNGRVIGEVVRNFETESGPQAAVVNRKVQSVLPAVCGDLSAQLVEAWKSGTFGATLLKLTLLGEVDYPQVVQFKKVVAEQVKEIKVLRERLFAPGQTVFELDSAVGPDALAPLLTSKNFQLFRLALDSKTADGIVLRLQSTRR
jgi:hypothetical protein